MEEETEVCKSCNGTGKEYPECEDCSGYGWVYEPDGDGGTMVCPKCDDEKCAECDGTGERPTKHAPDVVESAASVSISAASEVSASEADSTPATTQVM